MPPRRAPPRRPARARPRVRLENDQRRAQLLALAKRAFSEQAYDEVSIDDLAREAKISKGLLYHYFPTKRDLYVAGLTEIANELVAAITAVPEVALVVEGVRRRLFEKFLSGSPFAGLVAGDPRFELAIRGWIGFVEAASIDWCARPRLSREELRELLAQILFEVVRVAAPGVIRR